MQDQPNTTTPPTAPAAPATPAEAPSAPAAPTGTAAPPASAPTEPVAEAPAQDPNAKPPDTAVTAQKIEGEIREKSEKLEAAAKDLGRQLDEKLSTNETAREVKQKVGGFWNKIKETIK